MAETTVATEQQQAEVQPHRAEVIVNGENLVGAMFGVETPKKEETTKVEVVNTPTAEPPKVEATPPAESEDEIIEPAQWLKQKWGWENEEQADTEIKELRELKNKKPQDLNFANEESKKIFELLREGKTKEVTEALQQQAKIDALLSTEVNAENAADIIKTALKLKHPSLTDAQIDFQYRQEYGIPKEPVRDSEELEEEFTDRMAAYKEQVDNIKMKATIAATMAKPDIEKAKTQIVLPDINQGEQQKQLTQEELAAAQQYAADYLKSVENSMKDFNGFSVEVKHEGVDFPVTYGVTNEEKTAIANQLSDFVKSNYDANQLFATRWVNEDGTLKAEQMVKDLSLLNNADKAFNKFANDAAAKALENYIKGKKNIDITPKGGTKTVELKQDDKTDLDLVRDQFFG